MAAFISVPVSSAIPKVPSPSPAATSSLVPPNAASSKSWIALEQVHEQGAEAGLDHVAAEQHHDRPAASRGRDVGDDGPQVAGGEHVGERVEERVEAALPLLRRGLGQERRIHLVRAACDRHRPYPREIRLRDPAAFVHGVSPRLRSASVSEPTAMWLLMSNGMRVESAAR